MIPSFRCLLTLLFLPVFAWAQALEDYNVIWTSQSRNSSESMPCGGGDIGLNVWVEKGELLLYLSRSGSFDELNGMPKLGRLRLSLTPNPFAEGAAFRQELKLREGYVEVKGQQGDLEVTLRVWVDVKRPVVHLEMDSSRPVEVLAAYENWRTKDRPQVKGEWGPTRSYLGAPEKAIIRADEVGFQDGRVVFVHRNRGRTAFDLVVEQQQLTQVKDKLWNPLKGRAFGGSLAGDNFEAAGTAEGVYADTPFRAWRLKSKVPAQHHSLRAVLHVATTKTEQEWDEGLDAWEKDAAANPALAWEQTKAWWAAFWARSHVFIAPQSGPSSQPWQLGRNYQLFRYQLACNARSEWPTKFNGGLFTFDPGYVVAKDAFTPDFRRWGGGSFTAQNQRLVYWPMLKSGDTDLMLPQFDFYLRLLGNAELRSQVYWGIQGASFSEQIENFGLPVGFEYNWKRNPSVDPGIEDNAWVNYQWDSVFEFCQMILEARRYAGLDIARYLPLIESCLSFYDGFYRLQEQRRSGCPLGKDGKLVLYPGTACETYKDALNPATTVSALRSVLRSLLALPPELMPEARRSRWEAMLETIPELAFREKDGLRMIAPAWSWSRIQNVELPQLYPVYPWGLLGLGRPDLQTARNTWTHGNDRPEQKQIVSWHQDAIFCARLGLTEEAARLSLQKLGDSERRFPTFWGPGHDWVPDHNWGGSGMIGIQEMLLQEVDGKLLLLPAWPADWDVDFKLHAPGGTLVEATQKAGRLTRVRVTPEAKTKDLVLP